MNDNGNVSVSKLENWLDTMKIVCEIIGAITATFIGAFTISRGVRALKYKKNDPVGYWNNRIGSSETSKAVNRLADAVEKVIYKF